MTLEPTDDELDNAEELLVPPEPVSSNRTFLIVAGILGGIMLTALLALAVYAVLFAPQRRSQTATQVAQRNAENTQIALLGEQTAMVAEGVVILPTETETARPPATETASETEPVAALATVPASATQTVAATATQTTEVEASPTLTEEPTRVVAAQATQDSDATEDPRTATVAALLTQAAGAVTQTLPAVTLQATSTPTTAAVGSTPDPRTATVAALLSQTPAGTVGTPDPRTATVAALFTQAASTATTRTATVTALPATGFAEEVGVPGLFGMALVLIIVIFLARRLRTAF